MTDYTIYDENNAPEKAKEALAASKKENGMIPNLHGVMAEAPGLLEGYLKLHQLALDSSFSKEELTVVWQAINVEHNCHYCVPAHTAIAKSMEVDDELIDALRDEQPIQDSKLSTLRDTVLSMTRNRGYVDEEVLNKFFDAGYGRQQLLEIVLVLSQKVMSNYTNHLAETPLDAPFKKFDWSKS